MLLDTASLYFRAFYGVPDTVVAPDGSLLLSDDEGGRIYRIRWTGGPG